MNVTCTADTTSDGRITVANQTCNGTTEQGDIPSSTADWRALTVEGTSRRSAQNNSTTASSKDLNPWLPLPPWLVNDSVAQQNLLEELIKKNKDDMVPLRQGRQLCIYRICSCFLQGVSTACIVCHPLRNSNKTTHAMIAKSSPQLRERLYFQDP